MGTGSIAIIVVIVIVAAVRRRSRLWGGVLGTLLALGVAAWGYSHYAAGRGIAFAGIRLDRSIFIGMVAVWFALELGVLIRAWKARSRPT